MPVLQTPRLILRPWREADRDPFAALSAEPEVMRYLIPFPDRAASDAWIDRQMAHDAANGFCLWAAEDRATGALLGSIGLFRIGYEAHFTPAVEVGWRLGRASWGRGLASEAARASMDHGFDVLGLDEIVANTAPDNLASQAVMRRMGMTRDPADDFDHPRIAEGNFLRRQVLFRISAAAWRGQKNSTSE